MRSLSLFLFLLIAVLCVAAASMLFVSRYRSVSLPHDNKLHVVASFYPMAFFAQEIVGDYADVMTLTPAGVEPHDYEPSSGDIATIEQADLLLLHGFVEPWADKIEENLRGAHVRILVVGGGLTTRQSPNKRVFAMDPHVWLSPPLAKQEVQRIATTLSLLDPAHRTVYNENAHILLRKLDILDASYRSELAQCTQKEIVTSHAAFGYLADTYGLTQMSIAGLSPDEEPSAQELASVARFVADHHVRYIFVESLVSPKLSETIARETGAMPLELNPLEGLTAEQQHQGDDYFSLMNTNLHHLTLALQCNT